jgi:steroid delta-isomerase-like uncharacterized protein
MTREDVLALLALRQDALTRRDWTAFEALYADAARLESPLAGTVQGADAIVRATQGFIAAFPDAVVTDETPIIDGERAVTIGEVAGTHVGSIMGLPPSGRTFRFLLAIVYVVQNGRITHERRIYDFTGLLVQIGVLKAKPA